MLLKNTNTESLFANSLILTNKQQENFQICGFGAAKIHLFSIRAALFSKKIGRHLTSYFKLLNYSQLSQA